jgi:hypothetical protein
VLTTSHHSLYFFWSYHSASKDVYDLETAGKNVQLVLDLAKGMIGSLYLIGYSKTNIYRGGFVCDRETWTIQ